MTAEWTIRVADDNTRDRTQLTAVITEALTGLGLDVLEVAYPIELNPRPQHTTPRRGGAR